MEYLALYFAAAFAALVVLKFVFRLGFFVVKAGFFMLGIFWLVAITELFSTGN